MRRRESYRIGLRLPLSTTNCRFAVFSICSGVCNLRRFHTKLRSMDAQVLFRLFRAKTAQSHTAITSIAIRNANRLRIKRKIIIFRHSKGAKRPNKPRIKNDFWILRYELSRFAQNDKKGVLLQICYADSCNDKNNNESYGFCDSLQSK